MRAAQLAGHRRVAIVDTPAPSPHAGAVRVRLEGCGICASSLPVWEGRPWFRYPLQAGEPGHEGWGTIDAVGDGVEHLRQGDRVAFLSNRAFAEHDVAEAGAVVRLPRELDGRPFPGEALGCAMNIFRRSDVDASHTVVVLGAGFLGNLLVQLAKSAGARVIAVSRREAARELARACGADETLALDGDVAARIRDLTCGEGAARVIECIGAQEPLDLAANVIAERGRLVIAGYHQDGLRQVNLQQWNWLGIDVINAHERAPSAYVRGIEEAVDAVLAGRIDPWPLLTHTYALDALETAMDDVRERPESFVKGMVVF